MKKISICGREVELDAKYLDLSNNELRSLPTEIGKLEKLEYLDLCQNKMPQTEIEKLKEFLPNCIIYNDYEEN